MKICERMLIAFEVNRAVARAGEGIKKFRSSMDGRERKGKLKGSWGNFSKGVF